MSTVDNKGPFSFRGNQLNALSKVLTASEGEDRGKRTLMAVAFTRIGMKTCLIRAETMIHEKGVRRLYKEQGLRCAQGKTKSFEGFCRDPQLMQEAAIFLRAYVQVGGPATKETFLGDAYYGAFQYVAMRSRSKKLLNANDAHKVCGHYRQQIIKLKTCKKCYFEHIDYVRPDADTPSLGCPLCDAKK